MNSKHPHFLATSLALACGLTLAGTGWSQSSSNFTGFGTQQTENLIRRNSATAYSSQYIRNSVLSRSASAVGVAGVNQRNFLGAPGASTSRKKPFSSLQQGPTVSPYLALSAPRASASDYYSVIRPQQQQQERSQRQAMQQQRRLNQMAARAPFSTTGDENRAPTGHAAVFQSLGSYQNTGGYFPPPSPPKRRR